MTFHLRKLMLVISLATLLVGVACLRANSISVCMRLEAELENCWAEEVYRYANEYLDDDLETDEKAILTWGKTEQKRISMLEHCKYEAIFTAASDIEKKEIIGAVSASVRHRYLYLGRPIISVHSWGLGDKKLSEIIKNNVEQIKIRDRSKVRSG